MLRSSQTTAAAGEIQAGKIDYLFLVDGDTTNKTFSLSIKDSDMGFNETILNSLVGSLVKYSEKGKIEPYLAESFTVSEDRLIWSYQIRDNLFCEDGTPINAKTFSETLQRQIGIYAKSSTPIDFEYLIGYTDFLSNKSNTIKGLSAEKNRVIFKFDKSPHDLNEMLRMPYFGFWCSQNFLEEKNAQFVSSGPYKLSKSSTPNKIVIEKRADWFSVSTKSPSEIHFSYKNLESINDPDWLERNPSIIETNTRRELKDTALDKLLVIDAPPTWLATLILNPNKNSLFKKADIRQAFLNRIRENQPNSDYKSLFFYSGAQSQVVMDDKSIKTLSQLRGRTLTVAHFGNSSPIIEKLRHFLENSFRDTGVKFQFLGKFPNEDNWQQRMLSNEEFDIRFSSVAIGGQARNFILKMIFCTNLGVNYPDPSGRICRLITAQESELKPISNEFIQNFNQILFEDSAVVPLVHFGTRWLLTKHLDEQYFPPTVVSLLFESLRFK